jgi:hypothetical protein
MTERFNRNNFITLNGSRLFTAKEVADLIRKYGGDAKKERTRLLIKLDLKIIEQIDCHDCRMTLLKFINELRDEP